MCNGHGYCITYFHGEMPNWLSYRGEGRSLSFHIPPVFHGLVLWFVDTSYFSIIIRNKSNGIQLFEKYEVYVSGWLRYISRSEMAMEDYCGDDELELHISSMKPRREPWKIVQECGVHVIAGKLDSFKELAVGRNTVMPSPPPYHLLPHSHCGSIIASTPKQWSDFLFPKLQKHRLHIILRE